MSRFVTVIMLLLTLALPGAASAATPEHPNEFFLGIGDAGMLWAFEDVFVTIFSFGYVSYGEEKLGFQVVGGYQHHFSPSLSLGATASWAGSQRAQYFDDVYVGDVERRMYAVMLDGRARWFRRPSFQMYSGLGLGLAALADEDEYDSESTSGPCWHLVPIGMRVGRDVAAYAEFGIGWNGFLKAGITRRW